LFLESGGFPCRVDPTLPMPIRGLRAQVYHTEKAIYDNDYPNSQWTGFLPQGHIPLDNVLFAPLMIAGKPVGLLGIANKPGGFTENDARLASGFGELAAIALLNSRTLEVLKNNEEQFSSVTQTATDAIICDDSQGNIFFWNRAAEIMFGYSAVEILGRPVSLIVPERLREAHREGIQRVVSTGKATTIGETIETVGLKKDGKEFPIELSLSSWQKKEEVYFAGIIRDITKRKQAEEALRKARDELELRVQERTADLEKASQTIKVELTQRQRVEEEIQRNYDYQTTLNTLLSLSLEEIPLEELLKRALDLVLSIPWFAFESKGSVSLVEDEPASLVMKAQHNLGEPIQKACARIPFGKCLCGRAALAQEIQFADGLDDRHETRYEDIAPHGHYCVPILFAGGILGVMNIYLKAGHHRDPREEKFLTTIADTLAGVIQRKQAEEALRESETKYKIVADNTYDWEFWVSPENQFIYSSPSCERITGHTADEFIVDAGVFERIIHPDDLPGYNRHQREVTETPAPGEVEFRIIRPDGTWRWVEHACQPVIDSNGHFLGTRGNNRDVTVRKQRERELEAIATVSAALRTAQTRAAMLSVILDQLLDLLKADGAALALRDPITGETVIEMARGSASSYEGARIPPGQSVTGYTIATGKLYVIEDVRTDPRVFRPELLDKIRAVVCVPLLAREKTIGAISLARDEKNSLLSPPFSHSDVSILTSVADIAGNAIHRAALHEQTEYQLQRLAALSAIDKAIMGSMDLHLTLNILMEHITAQLHVDAAVVFLLNPHFQTLEYAAGHGFRSRAIERSRLRIGEGYGGRAVLERRSVHIPNISEAGATFVRAELLADEGFISYFAIPLILKGQVKGVLEIFHRALLNPDQEWMDFLETMSNQAAIAIENTKLFDDLQRSNVNLTLAYDATIEGWSHALDLRDKETEGHTQRVTEMTLELARQIGISEEDLVHIRRGGLLHDIGKMGVPDNILLKPGSLTEDEWVIMRKHPLYAYEMLSPIAYLRPAMDIPYGHHEKWDGSGYPRGLKGEQIPLAARIFAVIDVFDALTSDRPYREAWSRQKTLKHIKSGSGSHFDPRVVDAFLIMQKT